MMTLEADSVNVQALDMGHIVVDIDGVNITELINKAAENGYSLRVVDESDGPVRSARHHLLPLPAYAAVPHISRKRTTPGCTRCHTRPVTSVNQNGFILPDWLSVSYRYVVVSGLRLKRLGCQNVSSSRRHTHPVLWRQSDSSGCLRGYLWVYPLSTGNAETDLKSFTTETALDILITWLQGISTAIGNYLRQR